MLSNIRLLRSISTSTIQRVRIFHRSLAITYAYNQELIDPAVNGTVGILKSAMKNAYDSVKRIIVLSSCVAVMRDSVTDPLVLNENDWNDPSIEACERLGRNAPPPKKYQASKTLAEKGKNASSMIYQSNGI